MNAHPGDVTRPTLGASLSVFEIREGLAVPPTLAHVAHLILDARLVLRRANAGGIDEDAARLCVVDAPAADHDAVDDPGAATPIPEKAVRGGCLLSRTSNVVVVVLPLRSASSCVGFSVTGRRHGWGSNTSASLR